MSKEYTAQYVRTLLRQHKEPLKQRIKKLEDDAKKVNDNCDYWADKAKENWKRIEERLKRTQIK